MEDMLRKYEYCDSMPLSIRGPSLGLATRNFDKNNEINPLGTLKKLNNGVGDCAFWYANMQNDKPSGKKTSYIYSA